jgi:hypothetical protein
MIIAAVSGLSGFWGGYASNKKSMLEFVDMFARVPEVKLAALAYAFATPAQVKTLIDQEPPWPGEVKDRKEKRVVLRALRLAVVAASVEEREDLLAEATATCKKCKPESLRAMFQIYAQSRLVPPGDEIVCERCKPAAMRRTLPPRE